MAKNRFNLKGLFGKSFAEKRAKPRIENDSSVSFCIDHDFRWRSARVRDVSTPGMCLRSLTPFAVGQHLVIAATNPVYQALHGTVRWTRELDKSNADPLYEAGVEFHDSVSEIEDILSV